MKKNLNYDSNYLTNFLSLYQGHIIKVVLDFIRLILLAHNLNQNVLVS